MPRSSKLTDGSENAPPTRVGGAKSSDASDKLILGASILGVGGDELIHSLLDLMYAKAPYTVMQRAMHIHPTVSELLPTMLGELEPLAT
jgi:Pyridine nucleotide-disulphide oxidoreductase, dimerisation domain